MTTNLAALGSTQLDPSLQPQLQEDPNSLGNVAATGARRGVRLAGAGLSTLAGTGLEALGMQDAAQRAYATGQGLRQSAEALPAAPVQSFHDIGSVADAAKYAVNLAAESAAPMAAGLVGGLATRNPMTGMALATAPFEAGNIAMEQQADPVARGKGAGVRLANAIGAGAQSAALQSVVPGVMEGKLLGREVANGVRGGFTKNVVGSALGNGAAGAASQAIHQQAASALNPERDTSGDNAALLEAGVGGAALGAPMGAVGAVPDAFSRLNSGAKSQISGLADAIVPASLKNRLKSPSTESATPDTAGQNVANTPQSTPTSGEASIASLFKRDAANPDDVIAKRMADGQELVQPQDIEGKTPQEHADIFAASDKTAMDKAQQWANELWNDQSLSPQSRDELKQAMSNLSDKGAQAIVAGQKLAKDGLSKLADNIGQLDESVGPMFDKLRSKFEGGDTKKSDATEGARNVIENIIGPHLDQTAPGVLQDDGLRNKLADNLRKVLMSAREGDAQDRSAVLDAMTGVRKIFGGATTRVMTDLHDAVFGNESSPATERFFSLLNDGQAKEDSAQSMRDIVQKHLDPQQYGDMTPSELDRFGNQLKSFVSGDATKNMGPAQKAVTERQFSDALKETFGDKSDAVLKDMREHIARENGQTTPQEQLDLQDSHLADENGHVDTHGAADVLDTQYLGGKGDTPIPSEAEHRAQFGNENSQASRLMEQARRDNPDADVNFVSLRQRGEQEGLSADELAQKHPGVNPDTHGYVAIDRARSETSVSPADAKAALFNPRKLPEGVANQPGKWEQFGHIPMGDGQGLDAFAVTRLGRKLAGETYTAGDDKGGLHRMGRAFMEGLAAVQDRLGAKDIKLNDSTPIGMMNGKKVLWGDVKGLDYSPRRDAAWMEGKSDAEINKELNRRDLLREMDKPELQRMYTEYTNKIDQRAQAVIDEWKADKSRRGFTAADVRDLYAKLGETETGKLQRALEQEVNTRDARSPRENFLDSRLGQENDPRGNIHEAALVHGEEGIRQRTGLDDQAIRNTSTRVDAPQTDGSSISPVRKAGLDSAINRLESLRTDNGAKNQIARAVAEKARALYDNFDALSEADQRDLIDTFRENKNVGGVSPTVTRLAKKYEGQLAKKADTLVAKAQAEGVNKLAPKDVQTVIDHTNDPKLLDKANAHMERLMSKDVSGDTAYSLQRAGGANGPTVDAATKLAVQDYVRRVLGPRVKAEFAHIMHEGEYEDGVMRVSLHSLNPMSTAYHESLHGFMDQLRKNGQGKMAEPLFKAADSAAVRGQLRKLLANEPDALRQIESSPEERAAYMYQFWAAGKLDLAERPTTILGKIADAFRSVLGLLSNDQRALHIMEYFHGGDFAHDMPDRNAVARSLSEGTAKATLASLKKMAQPLADLGTKVAAMGDARLRDTGIPALSELADHVYKPLTEQGEGEGYLPAARRERTTRLNALVEALDGYTPEQLKGALEHLQSGTKPTNREERFIHATVRKTLDDMYRYMTDAGVKMGDLGYGKDYFPRVWDANYILDHQAEFKAMLQPYIDAGTLQGSPEKIMATLTRTFGSDLTETMKPGMQFSKERVLSMIRDADAAPFMRKNLHDIMAGYIGQATRRAEWARHFGDDGKGLTSLFERATKEGATQADLDTAQMYLRGVDGTLGDNIDPKLRRAFGNAIVYQNVRLLPLSIFSSLIDAGGIKVRGGTWGDSFSTFMRGFKEIPKGFSKDAGLKRDGATMLAEQLGVIDSAVLQHTIGSTFGQGMTGDFARKVNDTFFRLNLMEQYNRSMRVGATQAAMGFLARHADGTASPHSERWLAELGLRPGEVKLGADGSPLITKEQFKSAGLSDAHADAMADKMAIAINKWVDGAILRPNAAHKPIWMNDPHYALLAHLKQFVYSFQETILKRVAHEARYANYGPAMALAGYVPFMMAADFAKGLILGGGQQPSYKDGWDAQDYIWSGMQRAGLFGVGQFAIDSATAAHRGGTGLGALAGPTLEQIGDAVSVIGGHKQFGSFVLNAMPANQLFDPAAAMTRDVDD